MLASAVLVLCSAFAVSSAEPWPQGITRADTLASMQSGVITARDLRERLELMPWPGKEKAAQADSIKAKALSALISEKLLAAAFDRSGLQETPDIRRLRRGLENVFLRDLLYKEVAVLKAVVSGEQMERGAARAAEERDVMVFQVRSELDGVFLAHQLGEISSRDSLVRSYTDARVLRSSSVVVKYGTMEQQVEDAAYGLEPGRVSAPVWSQSDGWLVMVLLDRRPTSNAEMQDPAESRRAVERIELARSEAKYAKDFFFGLLAREQAQADSTIFEAFASALEHRWQEDSTAYRESGTYMFTSDLVDVLAGDLGVVLDSTLVRTAHGPLPLGEILELLRYESWGVPTLDPLTLRIELNERIKAMVANELLAQEARRRGYGRRESFRRDMRVWDDFWKSRRLYDSIVDTVDVSSEEMADYLIGRNDVFGDRFEVNVIEMLVPTDTDMRSVLQQLGSGRPFAELAAERTIRMEWKKDGGVSGFFKVGAHPEIGYRALLADSGALIGPVRLKEGFSVFLPLAKRAADGRTFDNGAFRSGLHARLVQEKRRSVPAAYVQELARQEGLTVNAEALQQMLVTQVNMFTRRYIGFGGIMTAVPMLSSQWDWLVRIGDSIQVLP